MTRQKRAAVAGVIFSAILTIGSLGYMILQAPGRSQAPESELNWVAFAWGTGGYFLGIFGAGFFGWLGGFISTTPTTAESSSIERLTK